MINNKKVYIDGKTKYSFTDVSWNAKWIVNNFDLKNKLIEIGSTDYIQLNKLAELINSKSKFEGEKLIIKLYKNKSIKFNSSMLVLDFIKKSKMKYTQIKSCRLCKSKKIKKLIDFGKNCLLLNLSSKKN